jgi:hypothetical protein
MANEFYDVMPTKQYASTLDILSQEKSKLMNCIWNKGSLVGQAFFNQLQAFEMTFGRARYAATTFTESETARRKMTKKVATVAVPLDKIDLVETLVDPKSDLSQSGIYAAGRAKDKIIWNALYGTAYTGEDGTTAVPFDSTKVIDVTIGGTGSDVGLNLDKILAGIEMLEKASIDLEDPMNMVTMVISPTQKKDYMNILELTSGDYFNKSLLTGRMTLPGLPNSQVIVSNMVPYCDSQSATGAKVDLDGANVAWSKCGIAIDVAATSHRAVTMFCKSGLGFGTWDETKVKVDQRADLNNIWQLWMELMVGAARLEESKVVLIECQE